MGHLETRSAFIISPAIGNISFSVWISRIRKCLPILLVWVGALPGYSQTADSLKKVNHFAAGVSVTNNGIAFIPAFSLGKPAVIFDMSAGRRLSFDPQLRFSLEGKPWTFLFSWRYKLLDKNKIKITVGAHPALNFRTMPVITMDSATRELTVVRRYMSGDIAPNYFLTKNTSIGFYYLYSHRLEKDGVKSANLIAVNGNFSNLDLINQFQVRFAPQLYYLRQVNDEGYYFTSTLVLWRKNFPLSISSIINKAIKTGIPGSPDFTWNIILTYSFNRFYVQK